MCAATRTFALLLILICAGCAAAPPVTPRVRSTVTVFHNLPISTAGTTYAFVALEGQASDLEYLTYQNDLSRHLAAVGWVAADRTVAQVLISFAYSIDQGRVATVSVPVFGQTGISAGTTTGTVDSNGNYRSSTTFTPDYGVTGYVPVSRLKYSRAVRVSIADRASVDANNTKLVYQASILSSGKSGVIAPVMPAMLDALFGDFPGRSGQTRSEVGELH